MQSTWKTVLHQQVWSFITLGSPACQQLDFLALTQGIMHYRICKGQAASFLMAFLTGSIIVIIIIITTLFSTTFFTVILAMFLIIFSIFFLTYQAQVRLRIAYSGNPHCMQHDIQV